MPYKCSPAACLDAWSTAQHTPTHSLTHSCVTGLHTPVARKSGCQTWFPIFLIGKTQSEDMSLVHILIETYNDFGQQPKHTSSSVNTNPNKTRYHLENCRQDTTSCMERFQYPWLGLGGPDVGERHLYFFARPLIARNGTAIQIWVYYGTGTTYAHDSFPFRHIYQHMFECVYVCMYVCMYACGCTYA